ncbi:MAG: DUF167 domain-containing protein [Candidatus Thermoplasmatota archaeon]|nr:DUF167 domain-containing protein [Candidatus Thermoplasmatota archaeon]MEE2650238.1 DUF167 domain-containing protein [Candidatus Thermoplasmatota archaeon]|tara:strand:- start:1651 stop:1950 length:300 start_codon:yes stop_codon:yes gene_type:complete
MPGKWIMEDDDGILVLIDLRPAAQRSRIVGIEPWRGRLKVSVSSSPVDGAANSELIALLAEHLGVERPRVFLQSGISSRRKAVRVEGVTASEAKASLGV